MEQPKVKIVLLDVNQYDRRKVAEAYENAVFETYDEARNIFGDEAGIYDLTTFMDACNDQEINLELYWVTYITIKSDVQKNKPITCPHCGSDKVWIIDNQSLSHNDESMPLDSEIYVTLECKDCKELSKTEGDINYRQPQK